MNLKSIHKYLAIITLAALIPVGVQAQDKDEAQGPSIDEIIAKVDNYIILKSELEKAYLNYLSQGRPASQLAKCQILAQMISGKLMIAKAEIDSVIVTDEEVENRLDRKMQIILSQLGGSVEELEKTYGKTVDQLKSELRDQEKEVMLTQLMQKNITQDIKVTPSEVKRFFNKIPKDSLPYFSSEIEVAQIVRIPKPGRDQVNAVKNKLDKIRDRVLAGESFEALAKEYSEDPGSKSFGGNMGFASRGKMVPEFEAAALKLKPGEISPPFQTDYGVHIVQLIERRGNEYNSRHILLSVPLSEKDIAATSHFLDSLRTEIIEQDTVTFEKLAKRHSDDTYTAGNGGYFLDEELGGTRISVEVIDPVVFFMTDTMAVGDISRPVKFRTDDNKEAVRILYYKSRVKPHQASLKDDWQRIQAAALSKKQNDALNEWFLKAREDVFISIDEAYDYCGIME